MSESDIVDNAINALCPRLCSGCSHFLWNEYLLPQQREKDGMCSLSFSYNNKDETCSKWEQMER